MGEKPFQEGLFLLNFYPDNQ